MKRTLIHPDLECFPTEFHHLLQAAEIYDSSSSEDARVFYINKDQGYFLKTASAGSLKQEAEMTRYFHQKGLAREVLAYCITEKDWLLTAQVSGEDCTHSVYLADPERLCDTLAELLWNLHQTDPQGCPVKNLSDPYLNTAKQNYKSGLFNRKHGFDSPQNAWQVVENQKHLLKTDTLIHGDYCLPNIILKNWTFSGFIDVDHGGIGDRHVDIYWALWSLNYNLKCSDYSKRFIDAYGRDLVDLDILKLIRAIECFG